jgi:hypothetical protein
MEENKKEIITYDHEALAIKLYKENLALTAELKTLTSIENPVRENSIHVDKTEKGVENMHEVVAQALIAAVNDISVLEGQ